MNETLDQSGFVLNNTGKAIIISLYGIISIIGTIGNTAIIVIFHKQKKRSMTSSETFITSLALSDLFASVFIPVVMINDVISPHTFVFGYVGCKILPSMNIFCTLASAWNLVIISIDRLRVIYFPFSARLSMWKRLVGVSIVWFIAMLVTSPMIYHLRLTEEGCWDVWDSPEDRFIYITVFELSTCAIPVIILAVCYTLSAKRLKTSIMKTENHTLLVRIKQNKKITAMFAVIVVIFVTLTTPYLVILFTMTYYATYDVRTFYRHNKILQGLNYGLFVLSAFNSTVNCFIYAKMYTSILKGFSRMSVGLQKISSIRRPSLSRTEFKLRKLSKQSPEHHFEKTEIGRLENSDDDAGYYGNGVQV